MDISATSRISAYMPIEPVKPSGPVETMRAAVAAVQALNKSEMMGTNRELQFTRDEVTKRPVVRILNRGTGEVVDQIPPEAVLRMLADLKAREEQR